MSPAAVHDLIPFTPAGDHVGNDARRVLQIGVDDDQRIAGCVLHAGGDSRLVVEISGEAGESDATVGARRGAQPFERPVGRPIVNEQQLQVFGQRSELGGDLTVQLGEVIDLVVGWNDHAYERARFTHHVSPSATIQNSYAWKAMLSRAREAAVPLASSKHVSRWARTQLPLNPAGPETLMKCAIVPESRSRRGKSVNGLRALLGRIRRIGLRAGPSAEWIPDSRWPCIVASEGTGSIALSRLQILNGSTTTPFLSKGAESHGHPRASG